MAEVYILLGSTGSCLHVRVASCWLSDFLRSAEIAEHMRRVYSPEDMVDSENCIDRLRSMGERVRCGLRPELLTTALSREGGGKIQR